MRSPAERMRNLRRRRKDGSEIVRLTLPKTVRDGWVARERLSDDRAPLPLEQYHDDLADVLVEWAGRWMRLRRNAGR